MTSDDFPEFLREAGSLAAACFARLGSQAPAAPLVRREKDELEGSP